MVDEAARTLIIRYMDGTEQLYIFPPQESDPFTAGERIQEMLSARHLMLEVEGKLVIIPFQSVKTIEVSPPPDKLPAGVIRNVEFRHQST